MDWKDEYEIDASGRLRKKGHARDGELASFMFLDGGDADRAADDGVTRIIDTYGQPAGHRPGFVAAVGGAPILPGSRLTN
jgi:hypothetical protein